MDAPGSFVGLKSERMADLAFDRVRCRFPVETHGAAVEVVRIDVAEDDVGIGQRRLLPAASIADRARIGASALRPDLDQPHVSAREAAAAGADLEQFERRHVDRQSAAFAITHLVDLEAGRDRRIRAVDGPELRRGPAHVEGEDMIATFLLTDDPG